MRLRVENQARPRPVKAQPQQKLQCHSRRRESRSHRTKRFVSEPTLSPSVGADLPCRVILSPIGWKRNDNCSRRSVVAKVKTNDRESPFNKMENALVDLAQALRERLAAIRDEQSRDDEAKHIARLRSVSEKIDRLQAALPQPVDPRLAHYLQRRSYDKALEFLESL